MSNDGFDINDELARAAKWKQENAQRVADAWAAYVTKRADHYEGICPTCNGTGRVK